MRVMARIRALLNASIIGGRGRGRRVAVETPANAMVSAYALSEAHTYMHAYIYILNLYCHYPAIVQQAGAGDGDLSGDSSQF